MESSTVLSSGKRPRVDDAGAYSNVARLGSQGHVDGRSGAPGVLHLADGEQVAFTAPVSHAFFQDVDVGTGFVFVTTQRVVWMNDSDTVGLEWHYQHTPLFAVCRDDTVCAQPCLYLQLTPAVERDDGEDGGGDAHVPKRSLLSSETGVADLDLSRLDEARLVPADAALLDGLYAAMCECAAMHPDPADDEDEDGGVGGMMGMMMGMMAGEQRYDDAEGDEDGAEEEEGDEEGVDGEEDVEMDDKRAATLAAWDALLVPPAAAPAVEGAELEPGYVPAGIPSAAVPAPVHPNQFEDASS